MKNEQLEIVPAAAPPAPVTSLSILAAAVGGGINKENVDVVERLVALRREEVKEEAKAAFAKAFFQLRKEVSGMELYADKAAKTGSGAVAYTYCSETELSEKLEPLLLRHGFAMMFGQSQDDGKIVVSVTLMHEAGHQETRDFAVRPGATNAMKDATSADAGAATTAWRHLVIKLFGLKSRIRQEDDPRNLGERITNEQAAELSDRVQATGSDEAAFLKYAGVVLAKGEVPKAEHYRMIFTNRYSDLCASLTKKEQRGR